MRVFFAAMLAAASVFAADVTGTWYAAVELSAGSGAPTLTFDQKGNKITGKYSGTLGDVPLAGVIDGNKIEFSFEAEASGQKFKVVYSGTLKNDKEMEGKVVYGELGDGTFTAKKKE